MLIFPPSRRYGLSHSCLWWPESPGVITSATEKVSLVSLKQVESAMLENHAPLIGDRKTQHTTIVSLSSQPEDLMHGMDPKSCRSFVRKAGKLNPSLRHNCCYSEVREVFDEFIKWKAFRPPLKDEEWNGYRENCEFTAVFHEGRVVAAHVLLRDYPHRIRLLMSATAYRRESNQPIISAMNRWLHWQEFLLFQSLGYRAYDFGGIVINGTAAELGISSFKRSFGGEIVAMENAFLSRFPVVRLGLKMGARLKRRISQHLSRTK